MKKIINFENLQQEIEKIKSQGSIVLVGGCFDILHTGHKTFLDAAKKEANTLIVLLESDKSVQKRKGDKRPVNSQKNRASILASIPSVSHIVLLPEFKNDQDYYKLTKLIKPAIIAVTENDPLLIIKQDQAKMVGGRVIQVIKRVPNKSTSQLIENIQ